MSQNRLTSQYSSESEDFNSAVPGVVLSDDYILEEEQKFDDGHLPLQRILWLGSCQGFVNEQ